MRRPPWAFQPSRTVATHSLEPVSPCSSQLWGWGKFLWELTDRLRPFIEPPLGTSLVLAGARLRRGKAVRAHLTRACSLNEYFVFLHLHSADSFQTSQKFRPLQDVEEHQHRPLSVPPSPAGVTLGVISVLPLFFLSLSDRPRRSAIFPSTQTVLVHLPTNILKVNPPNPSPRVSLCPNVEESPERSPLRANSISHNADRPCDLFAGGNQYRGTLASRFLDTSYLNPSIVEWVMREVRTSQHLDY
jgi:hypothetical protein